MFTSVPEQVARAVVVAAGAAVHAQDGGGVEGDDGVTEERKLSCLAGALIQIVD